MLPARGISALVNNSTQPTDPAVDRGDQLAVAYKRSVKPGRRFSLLFLQLLEKLIQLVDRCLDHPLFNRALKFIQFKFQFLPRKNEAHEFAIFGARQLIDQSVEAFES